MFAFFEVQVGVDTAQLGLAAVGMMAELGLAVDAVAADTGSVVDPLAAEGVVGIVSVVAAVLAVQVFVQMEERVSVSYKDAGTDCLVSANDLPVAPVVDPEAWEIHEVQTLVWLENRLFCLVAVV